jgi:DNA-binding IclR family transcriptional regulator
MADDVHPFAEPRSGRDLQGVGRAFAVLEQVGDRPMRASDIARNLGLPWATTHRLLTYLTERGYLERDAADRRYSIGVRAYSLGSSYLARLPLHHVSHPYLEAAATVSRATAQLVKRDHRRSVILSVAEAPRHHMPEATIGCNYPLHCGSKGHVLLAYADPAFVDDYLDRPLETLTPMTIVDPAVLRERFAEVRARGYAVTDRDVRLFSASVAAPVFGRTDEVVASLTLLVSPPELRKRQSELVELVLRTARGVSRLLSDSLWPEPIGGAGRPGVIRDSPARRARSRP